MPDLDELLERMMAEAAEDDCDQHIHATTITYVCDANARRQRRRTIAAILRLLAEYTDGFCSVRDALDADLGKATGITFRFSSIDKRRIFRVRMHRYLNAEVIACLHVAEH